MRQAPLLVVLDEPNASLDAPSEAALFARYAEAARRLGGVVGTITVLVSHRFSSVHMADQIVVLDGGRVAETGDHTALLARPGISRNCSPCRRRATSAADQGGWASATPSQCR
jgi:ATP-binding cassette subfamily B protein